MPRIRSSAGLNQHHREMQRYKSNQRAMCNRPQDDGESSVKSQTYIIRTFALITLIVVALLLKGIST